MEAFGWNLHWYHARLPIDGKNYSLSKIYICSRLMLEKNEAEFVLVVICDSKHIQISLIHFHVHFTFCSACRVHNVKWTQKCIASMHHRSFDYRQFHYIIYAHHKIQSKQLHYTIAMHLHIHLTFFTIQANLCSFYILHFEMVFRGLWMPYH